MKTLLNNRRYRSRLKPLTGRPDLTPLVDVLFLALIFFMLSSTFVQVSGIKVDLPRVNASSTSEIEKFIVSISHHENGSLIYFNDHPVSWDSLAEEFSRVSAQSRTATVVVCSDGRTPFEVVARVMALAENVGLACFVAVMPPEEKVNPELERETAL